MLLRSRCQNSFAMHKLARNSSVVYTYTVFIYVNTHTKKNIYLCCPRQIFGFDCLEVKVEKITHKDVYSKAPPQRHVHFLLQKHWVRPFARSPIGRACQNLKNSKKIFRYPGNFQNIGSVL